MQELINNVIQWANDRNLIKGSTPYKQGLKLMSEYGELCDSIAKNDIDGIKDGIGDIAVVVIILSEIVKEPITAEPFETKQGFEKIVIQLAESLSDLVGGYEYAEQVLGYLVRIAEHYDLTLEQCLEHAYNEIKERKGVMYEGVFIKESDPRYTKICKLLGVNHE